MLNGDKVQLSYSVAEASYDASAWSAGHSVGSGREAGTFLVIENGRWETGAIIFEDGTEAMLDELLTEEFADLRVVPRVVS